MRSQSKITDALPPSNVNENVNELYLNFASTHGEAKGERLGPRLGECTSSEPHSQHLLQAVEAIRKEIIEHKKRNKME